MPPRNPIHELNAILEKAKKAHRGKPKPPREHLRDLIPKAPDFPPALKGAFFSRLLEHKFPKKEAFAAVMGGDFIFFDTSLKRNDFADVTGLLLKHGLRSEAGWYVRGISTPMNLRFHKEEVESAYRTIGWLDFKKTDPIVVAKNHLLFGDYKQAGEIFESYADTQLKRAGAVRATFLDHYVDAVEAYLKSNLLEDAQRVLKKCMEFGEKTPHKVEKEKAAAASKKIEALLKGK